MNVKKIVLLILSLFFLTADLVARDYNQAVIDEASLLTTNERELLETDLRRIWSENGAQMALLIVPTLGQVSVEEYSIKVTDEWKLGESRDDRGLLILVAIAEKKIRIEVGRGLEGFVTDYESSKIIRTVLAPAFKSQNFYEGLKNTIQELEILVAPGAKKIVRYKEFKGVHQKAFFALILFLIFSFIMHAFLGKKPYVSGLLSAGGAASLGIFVLGQLLLPVIIFLVLAGFIIGFVGPHHFLLLLLQASSGGRGGSSRGSSGYGGGGGGFGGGGSSGDW
jgi:uncharacterized protein